MKFKVEFQELCTKQWHCPDVKTIDGLKCQSCINQYVKQFNLHANDSLNDYVVVAGEEKDCLTFILAHDGSYIFSC